MRMQQDIHKRSCLEMCSRKSVEVGYLEDQVCVTIDDKIRGVTRIASISLSSYSSRIVNCMHAGPPKANNT